MLGLLKASRAKMELAAKAMSARSVRSAVVVDMHIARPRPQAERFCSLRVNSPKLAA